LTLLLRIHIKLKYWKFLRSHVCVFVFFSEPISHAVS